MQMETFFARQYINVLLYVNGVKSIETKNVQIASWPTWPIFTYEPVAEQLRMHNGDARRSAN